VRLEWSGPYYCALNVSSDIRLTPTSYVVLGMLDWLGPSSPYKLKKLAEGSIADFYPVPHTTFYDEPARLAEAGYLEVTQEEGGRRRKRYALAARGRRALADWLADPEAEPTELRSPALLKIFFGAEAAPLAEAGLARHRALVAFFERIRDTEDVAPAPRRALETGIGYHSFWVAEWERLGAGDGVPE
jgi:PadR family transcriptional regulator, regulatory protein AphA